MFKNKQDTTTPETKRFRGNVTPEGKNNAPKKSKIRLEKVGGGNTLQAIREVNEMVDSSIISVTEITSTNNIVVRWPGAFIKIKGMRKSIAVIFPTEGVLLTHLRNKMQLLASDAFDSLYKGAIRQAGCEYINEVVTYLSIDENRTDTIVNLINGLIEEFNDEPNVNLAKFSKDSGITIAMEFSPGDSVSPLTGFPITKQFDIITKVSSNKSGVYSIHAVDDIEVSVGGYTRPIIVNTTETRNENGVLVTQNKLKFNTAIILNDIRGDRATLNHLLTGVLGVIATNQSLPSLMANVASCESPDLVGAEHIANPNAKDENPLHSLRPEQLAERLSNIFTDKQTISVEVSLCTMPELYYMLDSLHIGSESAYTEFYDRCEETFGVRPPDGFPIFLKERVEYPVGIITTETGKTPLTSLSPSRLYAETGDELSMLKLMNTELGISSGKPSIEEHIGIVADVIGDAVMYERGLKYQFTTEFLQYVMSATSGLRIEVDNHYIVTPSIQMGMNNFAINSAIELNTLTGNLNMGHTTGGYSTVGAHQVFQPRVK